jgi:hypothetical protein
MRITLKAKKRKNFLAREKRNGIKEKFLLENSMKREKSNMTTTGMRIWLQFYKKFRT